MGEHNRRMGEVTNQFRAAHNGRDGALVVVQASRILRIIDDRTVERIRISPPLADTWRVDRAGDIWVGTYERGLHILSNGVRRAIPAQQSGGTDVHALSEDPRDAR